MSRFLVFGERSLTLVGASFEDRRAAERAAVVLAQSRAATGEVSVIAPHDPTATRKFEPEQAGIWSTLLRSHAVLMLAGALAGAAAALGLANRWEAAAMSPGYTMLFLSVLGAFLGGLVAGALTLRPDHAYVIRRLKRAMAHHRWVVAARPLDEPGAEVAMKRLRRMGAHPVRSW